LLSVWLGFRRLRTAGLVERVPRLVAVQAEALAPLCRALEAGLEKVPPLEPSAHSVAEGLAIAEPVRGRRLLEVIRDSGGTCVAVADDATLAAQGQLARAGLYIEPTSATAIAALGAVLPQVAPEETLVVALTGSGLKGSPR
jgi:threonine synthase